MSKIFLLFIFGVALVKLATSSVSSQGRFSGMDRMKEPEIDSCLRSKICPVTLELAPTCASDGRTYPNRGTIKCLNDCLEPNEKVTIASAGFCINDISQSK